MKHFLNAAEIILRRFNIPLNVSDIVERAISDGTLKTKGKTPENTMRARLSEHIRVNGKNSTFIRVASNKFALREWKLEEYSAPPFTKTKTRENVVCIKQDSLTKTGRFFGFSSNYKKYIDLLKDPSNIVIRDRLAASSDYSIKQLVAYVIIKDNKGKVLSYVRGNYTTTSDRLLSGVLCIGFGGHVNDKDYLNLFGLSDGGINFAALREVKEELRNIQIESPKLVGVINDDSSPLGLNHFAFVFTTEVTDHTKNLSTELSITKTKFLSYDDLTSRFSELEFWSQLVFKGIMAQRKHIDNIVIKTRVNQISFPIIIVGEVGSGKSEIAKLISRKLQCKYVSTRKIVSELIKCIDFGTSNRASFQENSMEFIRGNDGSLLIAQEIIKSYISNPGVIVDGIRNIKTYEHLKKAIPSSILVYIDVPIDNSYEFFRSRSKRNASINEFRMARYHDVEKEVVLLKNRADVYIYNGASFKELIMKIDKWLDETI